MVTSRRTGGCLGWSCLVSPASAAASPRDTACLCPRYSERTPVASEERARERPVQPPSPPPVPASPAATWGAYAASVFVTPQIEFAVSHTSFLPFSREWDRKELFTRIPENQLIRTSHWRMDDSSTNKQLLCRELGVSSHSKEDQEPLKHSLKTPHVAMDSWEGMGTDDELEFTVFTGYFRPIHGINTVCKSKRRQCCAKQPQPQNISSLNEEKSNTAGIRFPLLRMYLHPRGPLSFLKSFLFLMGPGVLFCFNYRELRVMSCGGKFYFLSSLLCL
nr:uncharacterized protein LOC105861179 isoform X1 [Microcebus murinus]